MKQVLLVVLFGFLVLIHPAQELNQYDYHSADKPTITEFAYLPDVKMTPHPTSVSIEKQKVIGPFVSNIRHDKLPIHPTYPARALSPSDAFPDALGFLDIRANHSNYLSFRII
ncbi:hypothetical protein ABFG93_13760 [Pseudalkalibacillus hwajinpoensis]|uniref:hypothetical protein n=1 Tax=Guptibacillus hwajinpoensis TaxID=208199 RepID=UPI00325B8091